MLGQQPQGAVTAEELEQDKPGRHRRHHERQSNQRLDQRFSRPIAPRQKPRQGDAEGKDEQGAESRHTQSESDDLEIVCRHGGEEVE